MCVPCFLAESWLIHDRQDSPFGMSQQFIFFSHYTRTSKCKAVSLPPRVSKRNKCIHPQKDLCMDIHSRFIHYLNLTIQDKDM